MERDKWLVISTLVICNLVAFTISLCAGENHNKGVVTLVGNATNGGFYYCRYKTDPTFPYAVAGFVLLIVSQIVLTIATRCLCIDGEHEPGKARTCAFVSFCLQWICFLFAEIFFYAGANKNTIGQSIRYIGVAPMMDKYFTCETIHRSLFGGAAAFTSLTLVAGVAYYICLVTSRRVTETKWHGKTSMKRAIPSP